MVSLQYVAPRKLAAVRRQVAIGEIARAWRPALDEVWAFLRGEPDLHAGGHNVFLYRHPAERALPMQVDFGVEVTGDFPAAGNVFPAETPAGDVATALHVGRYDQLQRTHEAIHAWCAAQRRSIAGMSWEIYGDWSNDETKLETTVVYLLA